MFDRQLKLEYTLRVLVQLCEQVRDSAGKPDRGEMGIPMSLHKALARGIKHAKKVLYES